MEAAEERQSAGGRTDGPGPRWTDGRELRDVDGRTAPARQTLSSSPCYESHLLPVDYAGLDLTLTLDPILC